MDYKSRTKLETRIKSYFIDEVRKECGEDFKLIEDRIDSYLQSNNLKDAKFLAKAEINMIKNGSANNRNSDRESDRGHF
ncbi:hypothetical protein WBG78_16950 [Chryseolinea sp. T2]|uniref:hypothetical protein n=1 Tax=Chryseolinea sp. T2 TaxID=3129255 RepID=UPI003077CFF7